MNDVVIRAVETSDAAALKDFFARIPEGDRTFFKEDMLAPGAATAWAAGPRGRRLVVKGQPEMYRLNGGWGPDPPRGHRAP